MELALISLGILSGLELLLWWKPLWRWRKLLACVLIVALAVVSGLVLVSYFSVWVVLVTVFSLYRLINLLRLVEGRLQPDYLYHTTLRTATRLIGLQGLIYFGWLVLDGYHVNMLTYLYIMAGLQLLASLVIVASTLRHLRTTRPPKLSHGMADRDLPSLTVAIPARNESEALVGCLESLLTSSYPKLEILVLDDCSQNKHTSEIIRGFAHAGVRFVAGKRPPEQWLAKNYAYQQLVDTANGELLLFCGVNTRFEPGSLTELVKLMLHKKKQMISFMPRNVLPQQGWLAAQLVQPARYAWELALPRRLLQRPPVLGSCWLIERVALDKVGGFAAAARKTVPESYLARAVAHQADGYSFLQATARFGLTSHKTLGEQRDTAVRTRYPQLHRRPELVALVGLTEMAVLVWPLIATIVAGLSHEWWLAALSALGFASQAYVFSRIVSLTYRRRLAPGFFLLPLAALYDLGLLNYSMWQYEFREVIWKGRNVCLPVMHVTKSLPKI